MFGRNPLDSLDSYGLQTVRFEVLLQRTDHELQEPEERTIVDHNNLRPKVRRGLMAHDAAATQESVGGGEIFGRQPIAGILRPSPWSGERD
jgi:hypothetical protein